MRYRTWEFSRQLFGNQPYRRGGDAFKVPQAVGATAFPVATDQVSNGRRASAFPLAPSPLSRGRRGWVCGGMSRMGRAHAPDGLGRNPTPVLPCAQDSAHVQAATELTWVKAHCLRGTASRATERTGASAWAGARRAIHGVSRKPAPSRQTRETRPHWLFAQIHQKPGNARRPANPAIKGFRSAGLTTSTPYTPIRDKLGFSPAGHAPDELSPHPFRRPDPGAQPR